MVDADARRGHDEVVGLLRWLFGGGERLAPTWSTFESIEDFDAFVEEVAALLEERGTIADRTVIRSGSVMLEREGKKRLEWHLSLLAEHCARSPRDDWGALVARSLRRALGESGSDSSVEADTETLTPKKKKKARRPPPAHGSITDRTARPAHPSKLAHLRLQLFSEAYLAATRIERSAISSREIMPGLHAVLVADLGGGEVTIKPSDLAGFRWTDDDLFRLGHAQSMGAELGRLQTMRVGEGAEAIEITVSNGPYLGGAMLTALEHVEAPHGVLVLFMTWHHVITQVVSASTPGVLDTLFDLAKGIRDTMEITLSEDLDGKLAWFRRDSGFVLVELDDSGPSRRIIGPPELLTAM